MGAEDAEFILPPNLVRGIHIVGLSEEDAETLKAQSKPEEPPEESGWDKVGV